MKGFIFLQNYIYIYIHVHISTYLINKHTIHYHTTVYQFAMQLRAMETEPEGEDFFDRCHLSGSGSNMGDLLTGVDPLNHWMNTQQTLVRINKHGNLSGKNAKTGHGIAFKKLQASLENQQHD